MNHTIGRRTMLTGLAAAAAGVALPATAAASTTTERVLRPSASGGTGSQLAFLNHTWLTLDTATAEAVSANAYLKEFGVYEERTTTNAQQTYTGRYLYGRQTYLEMFGEGQLPDPDGRRGATGLALSPDRKGDVEVIKQRMVELGVAEPFDDVQTRVIDGEQVPWFRVVAPTLTYQGHFSWVMEYLESYLDDPRTDIGPPAHPGDVSRDRYLPDTYRNRLVRDVVGVEIDLPAADLPAVVTTLRAAGYPVRDRAGVAVATGRSDAVVLRPVDRSVAGWRRITFALNGPATRHTEHIGRSRLDVADCGAVWSFERG